MRHAGKHIETFRRPGHRLGHQFTGKAGQRHAMAGKTLQIEYIGRQPAEIGRAAPGDVKIAAPWV